MNTDARELSADEIYSLTELGEEMDRSTHVMANLL